MTLIVGGLLAWLLIEVADGFANRWSGREAPWCNESAIPELTVFSGAVLLLAGVLRRVAGQTASRV